MKQPLDSRVRFSRWDFSCVLHWIDLLPLLKWNSTQAPLYQHQRESLAQSPMLWKTFPLIKTQMMPWILRTKISRWGLYLPELTVTIHHPTEECKQNGHWHKPETLASGFQGQTRLIFAEDGCCFECFFSSEAISEPSGCCKQYRSPLVGSIQVFILCRHLGKEGHQGGRCFSEVACLLCKCWQAVLCQSTWPSCPVSFLPFCFFY